MDPCGEISNSLIEATGFFPHYTTVQERLGSKFCRLTQITDHCIACGQALLDFGVFGLADAELFRSIGDCQVRCKRDEGKQQHCGRQQRGAPCGIGRITSIANGTFLPVLV